MSLGQALFQAARAAACHNATLAPLAMRFKKRGKPQKRVSPPPHESSSQAPMP